MLKQLFAKIFASNRPSGKIDFTNLESILINPIGTGIGDAIVLTCAIRQLRNTYPTAKIGVIYHARNKAVFNDNPLKIELVKQSILYAATHRNKWQLFLDCSTRFTTRNILFSFLLNFKYVICFEKEEKKYYNLNSVKNYNEYVTGLDKIHLSQFVLHTCLKNYLKENAACYVLPHLRKEDEANILPFIIKDKFNIMVCPFGTTRKLDHREWKAIFQGVVKGNETKFHLMFPHNVQSAQYLLEDSKIMQTILPDLTLFQWFGLIAKADLVIAVDSAAVHVASAYNKPLVAFYGGKQPFTQFAPLPSARAITIVSKQAMPKKFNGTMKGYDCEDTALKIKQLISLLPMPYTSK